MSIDDIFSEYSYELQLLADLDYEEKQDSLEAFLNKPRKINYHFAQNEEHRDIFFSFDLKDAAVAFELGKKGKYVLVYLDFITEESEGLRSYSFDLVTPRGLYVYQSYLGTDVNWIERNDFSRISTYIQLSNIKTELKVAEKQYYLLKLDSLDKSIHRTEQVSLYISVYDYSLLGTGDAAIPVLKPFPGMIGLVYNGPKLPNPVIPSFAQRKVYVKVNNVGQGNWNEVISRAKTRVVYDIGTYKEKKKRDKYIIDLIQKHSYDRKPSLILSHWDLDHYNVFLYMTDKEREQFSQLIVTSTIPSLTPFRMLQSVYLQKKVEIELIDNNFTLSTGALKPIDLKNSQLNLFVCPLKQGMKKVYTNESGLLLDVNAVDKNVLLTGDSSYDQANEAVNQSYATFTQEKDHYLVIPHHGGGHTPNYQMPKHCHLKACAISVDEYRYDKIKGQYVVGKNGHPTIEVECHFMKKHGCCVYRTDCANDDIIM